MELSQLFLRSLKLIAVRDTKVATAIKWKFWLQKKINLETPDGRRLNGTRRRGELGFHNSGVEPLLSTDQ